MVHKVFTMFRKTFVTFGIPDELASDGGLEFTATSTNGFQKHKVFIIGYHLLRLLAAVVGQKKV